MDSIRLALRRRVAFTNMLPQLARLLTRATAVTAAVMLTHISELAQAQASTPATPAKLTVACGTANNNVCKLGDTLALHINGADLKSLDADSIKIGWNKTAGGDATTLNWKLTPNIPKSGAEISAVLLRDARDLDTPAALKHYPKAQVPLQLQLATKDSALTSVSAADFVLDTKPQYESRAWFLETLPADTSQRGAAEDAKPSNCGVAGTNPCGFGDELSIYTPNLDQWLDATGTPLTKLQLILNSQAIEGLVPVRKCDQLDMGVKCRLSFKLNRDPGNLKGMSAWNIVIGSIPGNSETLKAALGVDGGAVSKEFAITFSIHRSRAIVGGAVILTVLAILVWWMWSSSIVRDTTAIRAYPMIGEIYKKHLECLRSLNPRWRHSYQNPLSLGKTQMLIWFVLGFCSYVLIFVATGELNTLNNTALAVMGLSAGTAVGASLIDNGTIADYKTKADAWLVDYEKFRIAAEASNASADDKTALKCHLEKWPKLFQDGFRSDWENLVKGDNGDDTQLHRLQMLAFTVFLMITFGYTVVMGLAMPTFTNDLLSLMGISGGTYAGFKFAQAAQAGK